MTDISICRLDNRGLIEVTGPDADALLGRLITQLPGAATDERAGYGALLTPQGKIITDFFLVRIGNGYLLDCPAPAASDLLKRLTMFRMRADVALADVTADRFVLAAFGADRTPEGPLVWVRDPRLPALGLRAYPIAASGLAPENATAADWQENRIALGVPELGRDARFGDVFPHDLAMDSLHGVDFDKGCYVGQEVVSRMRYRGTARRRPLVVSSGAPLPVDGGDVLIDGRPVGTTGPAAGNRAVAIARLDKVADARRAGSIPSVDGIPVTLELPAWADYGWPDANQSDD